jgi:translocator protein
MKLASSSATVVDRMRVAAVVLLAVAQAVVAVLAGAGVLGEPIGSVAAAYPTPLLAADWAFGIWLLIYLGMLVQAGYQALPGQWSRAVHRSTGWWLAVAAVCNASWVLAFGARLVLLAQLLLFALLVCLAAVLARLRPVPATGRIERIVFRGPVALYAGWVSLAVPLGAAATGVWAGLPGSGALAAVLAVVVLLAVTAVVVWVVVSATAVVPYAAGAAWALAGIVLAGPPAPVAAAAVLAALMVATATARRVASAGQPIRAAWG